MYFKPGQVLLQENENYGGLRQALQKFQDLIWTKLEDDPVLGPNGSLQRLKIQGAHSKAANPNGVFGGGNENSVEGDGQSSDCIQEYLQEINEFIVKGLYKDIFGSSLGMSREEAEF